jgi:hypothetical protein
LGHYDLSSIDGYRLVYYVVDEIVTVTVIAVGKRDKNRLHLQKVKFTAITLFS